MIPSIKEESYQLPTGEADNKRLQALGSVWNKFSVKVIEKTLQNQWESPTILDVGCGNNTLLELFASRYPKAICTGVDFSEKQIEVAKMNLSNNPGLNINLQVCNVKDLHRLDKRFQIVHCRFFLSHIIEIDQAVEIMLARVEPGGVLIIEELSDELNATSNNPDFKGLTNCFKAGRQLIELGQTTYDATKAVINFLSSTNKYTYEVCLKSIEVIKKQSKSFFRMGAETMAKKFEEEHREDIIKSFGYRDGLEWIQEMLKWENDPSSTCTINNFTQIIIHSPYAERQNE